MDASANPRRDGADGPSCTLCRRFVDGMKREDWAELGVDADGDPMGAPAYHPRALLSVWLYGFMTGVRSTRKLETLSRPDTLPVAYGIAASGPQHPVAFLQEPPPGDEESVQAGAPFRMELGTWLPGCGRDEGEGQCCE